VAVLLFTRALVARVAVRDEALELPRFTTTRVITLAGLGPERMARGRGAPRSLEPAGLAFLDDAWLGMCWFFEEGHSGLETLAKGQSAAR
jgi:hypothetical protein